MTKIAFPDEGECPMRNVPVSAGLLFLIGTLILFSPITAAGEDGTVVPAGGKSITPVELAEMLKVKDFLLVNVHVPYAGEIPRTDSFIPFDVTTARIADYPRDKSAKIVVYCLGNRMALIAVRELLAAGYTNVSILDGGMQAWERARMTILHRNLAPSVPYPSASSDTPASVPEPCPCGLE
jgi:rhodanese-related sulfurtransferase